jgi:alpha-D-ribose 1-methylphosphonate 5-triphosphate synthase subunit PhnI
MGYVAVKGGSEAIEYSNTLLNYERIKGGSAPLEIDQIRDQLYLLVDRIMGEGSLYAPDLAALAIKQSAGDTLEASLMVRAFRTTLPRIGYSLPGSAQKMRIIRRISAAFKDIPGGQILGPTSDYSLRLLNFELCQESSKTKEESLRTLLGELSFPDPNQEPFLESFPKVIEILRKEGLLMESIPRHHLSTDHQRTVFDLTRQSLTFPAPRSAQLQAMARGETGGLLALAYTNMRGYGDIHPVIGELRVGFLPVTIRHPYSGVPYHVGEVKVTEAEIIARFVGKEGPPKFTLGYGLCYGQNEIKAISMAILDRAMQTEEPQAVSENQEFVLSHIDGIESMGFCNHWKLPHYVTFQSDLDRLRKARDQEEFIGPLDGELS